MSRNILQLIPGVILVIKHRASTIVKMMTLLLTLKCKSLWVLDEPLLSSQSSVEDNLMMI